MVNLAVAGASGRMGQAIIRQVADSEGLKVSAALDHHGSSAIGEDAHALAGLTSQGVIVSETTAADQYDVLVDFTTPEGTLKHIELCLENNRAILVGTTGMTATQKAKLKKAGEKIPVVLAANTSVSVNLCAALVETAARVIGEVTDIEIIEAHHHHKVDAPSGTALLLGEAAAGALSKTLDDDGVFSRHGIIGPRDSGTIGFSTIRGGDIAGEHTVMFIGESERLEITHRATDRKIFAMGALRAALWLHQQPAGFYEMRDVLGLNQSA